MEGSEPTPGRSEGELPGKPAPTSGPSEPSGVWAPYRPDADAPWDLRRVVHLHRRAAFGGTWGEIQRDLKDDPQSAVGRLLKGEAPRDGAPEQYAEVADMLATAAGRSGDANRLKAAWLYRIYFTPDPLTERLVLMWHNHFATSNQKLRAPDLMRRQNHTFRRFARAPFGALLRAMLHDPALLVWLDAPQNRLGAPNENLGRELMELFTLGIGHYTESDVKEAARALTGRSAGSFALDDAVPVSARQAAPAARDGAHDDGEKVILGRRGKWDADDLARILLEHPATARRLAGRVCELFLGERAVDGAAIEQLAAGLRGRDLDIGWAVETVLRSRAFFAAADFGTRVTDPVEFVVAPTRAVEWFDPPPSTLAMADWVTRLGQELFYPPNVGGWAGGRAWLSSRAVIGRANFAAALVAGELSTASQPLDLTAVAGRHGRATDLRDAVGFFADLLLGGRLSRTAVDEVVARAGAGRVPEPEGLRRAVAALLALPEAQVS